MSKPMHLKPSKLGTKEYWDDLYATEISNHAHNPSDTGTVWFDDSDAETKLIEFLSNAGQGLSPDLSEATTSFLDLGTGNGSLLFGLRDAGWKGPMLGVDYSRQSVEFARRIAESRNSSSSSSYSPNYTYTITKENVTKEEQREEPISFQEHDILHTSPRALLAGPQAQGWDVVLDKGTFDAISLSPETDAATGRRVSESYKARTLSLVRPGGLFLLTSCNWTEDELRTWFEGGEAGEGQEGEEAEWRFEQAGRVEYSSFSFGGVKGQTISSLCFRKIRNEGVGS
ncbi:putative S-adenosylmethionine-dependent methyltransferase of the seven beta-strand family [Hypoxylon sp. NC1633]|nr:putative S-adenosylmethionine-dependent methyltransferase of the seven beta-strand family [Hypoxylon sp. NC1633]